MVAPTKNMDRDNVTIPNTAFSELIELQQRLLQTPIRSDAYRLERRGQSSTLQRM